MRKPWTDKRMIAAACRIDELNTQVSDLVRDIREASRHPRAEAIADELESEPCVVLACARDVVEGILDDVTWGEAEG